MIKASEKASKILIRDFGEIENLQVSKKGPADFVTNSDLKAEKIILEELIKARPNYSIISEESGIEINKDLCDYLQILKDSSLKYIAILTTSYGLPYETIMTTMFQTKQLYQFEKVFKVEGSDEEVKTKIFIFEK